MKEVTEKKEVKQPNEEPHEMLFEDSIDILVNHVQLLFTVNNELDCKLQEAFNQAISALTRNIPQPLCSNHIEYYDNGKLIYDALCFCPNCRIQFFLYDNIDYQTNYCSNCGQALDWGDDNART